VIPVHSCWVWPGFRVLANNASHKMWKTLAGDAWPVPEPRDAGANGLTLCPCCRTFPGRKGIQEDLM